MMAKIPQGADFFNFSDVRAWRDCDDLIGLYHDWEALCEEQSGDYGIDCGCVRYVAAGAEVTVYDGDFDFDEVRLELLDRGFSVHEYRDAQVWGKTGFRWIALVGDLIIKGLSEEAVKGCIDVFRGVKDSLWDTRPAKDVATRLPQGIYMYYGAWVQFAGLMAFGTSYEKQEGPALKVTAVFMFEDEDAAHDAVGEIEDYMAELKVENIDVVQERQFVKVTGGCSLYPLRCAVAGVVTFPDPNLEAAIREATGKSEGPICRFDLESVTELEIGGRGISDLTGLEHCIGLRKLYLQSNQISDITLLRNLTSLTDLELQSNQISDISSLSNLAGLTRLGLLENQISDISPLSNLTSLTELNLAANKISDIAPLSNLTSLTYLNLSDNQISDITPLSNLTRLTGLKLDSNQISDLTSLSNLTSLAWLILDSNQISDLTPLSNLTSLGHLDLAVNQISDISPIANLTSLWWLDLRSNQISDITALSNLTSLTSLDLRRNQISDITPLSNLTGLLNLWLTSNQITDITPLSKLTRLISLDLADNQISDIEPLVANPGLSGGVIGMDTVNLKGNPLSLESLDVYIPQLQTRGVWVLW
jgi:internalin A